MVNTVTISLDEFDRMREEIKNLSDQIDKADEATKLLFKKDINSVIIEAQNIRHSQISAQARNALMKGEL